MLGIFARISTYRRAHAAAGGGPRRSLLAVVLLWLAAVNWPASAQSSPDNMSRPEVGGTLGPQRPGATPNFGASNGNDILRHRDYAGKPCLSVGAYARPHTVNPNLYDHVITVINNCPQRIAMQACYYRSPECIRIEIPGNERKEAVLGTLPAAKDFRFEFREKF